MVTNEVIESIINNADIVEVVSDYISLEKVGSNYRGLCPFHDDHSPSFYVSPTKKIATCMSCKEGGNVITFVQKIEKISFDEACKKVGERYGINVNVSSTSKKQQDNQRYYDITNLSTKFYHFYLLNSENGKKALDYLHKRRISDETINMFKIGLAPKEHNSLYLTLKDKGYLELDMLEAGVVKKGNDYYDLFNNRIVFPIIDPNNNTLGYSGRIFNNEDGQPKYVNSPGNVIFNKGDVFYNLNNALLDIRKKNRVIIMEGQMDVIASFNAGIRETICAMGTALTSNHAKLIKHYTNNVVLCYDGDDAGLHATERSIGILESERLNVNIVILPNKMDPDEYIAKYGETAFKSLFDNNLIDVWNFRYSFAKFNKDLTKIGEKEAFKIAVFNILKKASTTVKESILKMLCVDLDISLEAILIDFNNYYKQVLIVKDVEKPKAKEKKLNVKIGVLEAYKILVAYMLMGYDKARIISYEMGKIMEMERTYLNKYSDDFPFVVDPLLLIYKKYGINDNKDQLYLDFQAILMDKYYYENKTFASEEFKGYLDEQLLAFYEKEISLINISGSFENEKNECLNRIKIFVIELGIEELKKLREKEKKLGKDVSEIINISLQFKGAIEQIKK